MGVAFKCGSILSSKSSSYKSVWMFCGWAAVLFMCACLATMPVSSQVYVSHLKLLA